MFCQGEEGLPIMFIFNQHSIRGGMRSSGTAHWKREQYERGI